MFKANTSSTTTRRALTLGAGAFASVGLTAGAAAAVADIVPGSSPDELLALCAEFDAHERRYQAICERATTAEQERLDEPVLDALRDQQEPLLDRICALPCITPAGLAALANSLLLWDGELYIEGDDENADTNDRLLAALVRGVLRRAGS